MIISDAWPTSCFSRLKEALQLFHDTEDFCSGELYPNINNTLLTATESHPGITSPTLIMLLDHSLYIPSSVGIKEVTWKRHFHRSYI